jgi:hypothetical protein
VRDYSKILLRRTGRILWGPVERFITIGGGLVGILVVFNGSLIEWLVSTYQGIPWWVGLLILGALLLQAVFRAGYALWKEEEQAREKAEARLQNADQERESLGTKLREAEQEREELRQENEELIADSESHPDPLPDTLAEWLKTTPLITVPNQTYRNDRIELDGFHYTRCVFEDCTFSFKGIKPFRVAESCQVRGVVTIDARGPHSQAMLVFMKQLGVLHPDSQWYDFHDGRLIED